MSHSLTLPGCPHRLAPMSTEFALRWAGMGRHEIFDAYCRECVGPTRPVLPRGKDARNPFALDQIAKENQRIDNHVRDLRSWLTHNPCVGWVLD